MTEYAYYLLHLEQRLESYQRIHREELDEIRRAIVEARNQLLFKSSGSGATLVGVRERSPQVDDTIVLDNSRDAENGKNV